MFIFSEMNRSSNVRDRLGWSNNNQKQVNKARQGKRNNNNNTKRQCHRLPNFKVQRTSQQFNQSRNKRARNQQRKQNPTTAPVAQEVARAALPVQSVCQCACCVSKSQPSNSPPVVDAGITMFSSVPVLIYERKIRAAITSGCTFTKIGRDVASFAASKNCPQKTRIFENRGVRKQIKILVIPMGVRPGRTKPIECIVDRFMPPMGIHLGLAALKAASYRITVDRVVAQHHGPGASLAQQNICARSVENPQEPIQEEAFNEGDFIVALTEAEMREMKSWEEEE